MQNSDPLIWLGLAIIVSVVVAITVPYLRGKSDALTSWNLVLLGGAMFTGVGCLAVAYGDFHWRELKWFQPSRSDVQKYVLGSIAFYATLFFSYYVLSLPKKISAVFLNKWPPLSLPLVACMLIFGSAAVVTSALTQGVFFIGPALANISHKALVFSVVFSFCYWYQNKRQLPMLVLFLIVFALAALDAMTIFVGRRLLLSIAVAPLICMYWLSWRYKSPRKNLVRLGVAGALALSVAAFYSTVRHYSSGAGNLTERTAKTTIEAIKGTSPEKAIQAITRDAYYYFSQYCVHYSLLTIHLLDQRQIEVEPLNSLVFLAAYPIPRIAWPGKPQPLGIRMPSEVLQLPYRTNWGLGIVGNGYHEGGIPVIMLYAFLLVVCVRLLDDALNRQPNNVFLLGVLCTSAPHFAAMIRGEPSVMAAEIAESFAFAWVLGFVARFLFGTANVRGPAELATHSYWQRRGQGMRVGN